MSYIFGESWDCYATVADMARGYWDSGNDASLIAGRFAGSQALSWGSSATTPLVKSSAVNDAVHHIVVAFRQTQAVSGTSLGLYVQLSDAATNQCCIVFRSDGTILLTSAIPAGTVLATYSGAVTAVNTWYSFEFEVVIHNTTGSFKVRKNGSTADDHSTTGINTRPGANSYANKLTIAMNTSVASHQLDDLLWRSDAASVPWVGDIRCITRMPASDVSVQFARTAGATNASCVDEAQQNAATDYVYDSTPGHADLYTIASIASTPASTVAVTVRAFMQKSDAGTRSAAVQLKSGATTVASSGTTLSSSSWGWAWRTELTDPANGSAWTAVAVNNVQVGPVVTV
jgi:hypothetical protein